MRLNCYIAEYPTIIARAAKEGWLEPLVASHALPCTRSEAMGLLNVLPLPRNTVVNFRAGKGRAGRRPGQYRIGLPTTPGTRSRTLRVGLVIHEAAHIIDHAKENGWGHGETYCRVLRQLLVTIDWRKGFMPTSNFRAIYDRHRGPYCIMLIREIVSAKKDKAIPTSDLLNGPFNAEEAHEEARMLVTDPRENVTGAYVYSLTENQHIGAIYKRGETYATWLDLPTPAPAAEAVREPEHEMPDWAKTPAAAPAAAAPAPRPVEATAPAAKAATVRRKGAALGVGRDEGWPSSEAAQTVRAFFDKTPTAAPAEIIAALGTKLNDLGVAHPASLVSRLKQAGFLKEIAA